ncbi:hypothetical protein SADUNF_Sadunf19G0064800 [Salix dunnii]|uniref:Uncharacterized protein n=1 Tax=Salix dunnii TaxID=1413687 RepID=A0A835MCP0_9ROSI|nr:hypothetical protein SADUNF_Sadunf19G0064800 [Salix dunnii]
MPSITALNICARRPGSTYRGVTPVGIVDGCTSDRSCCSAATGGTPSMEGVPPSFMEDYVNQLEGVPSSPPEEIPVNQSSMLCNDQAGQHTLVDNNDSIQQTTQFPTSFPQTMTAMGGLDGTSSSWINQNGPNWPQTASSDQQWTNQLAMSNQVPGMLPQPPMNQWSPQFPPHNLQVSGDHNQGQNENHSSGPDSSLQSQNRGLNIQQVRI